MKYILLSLVLGLMYSCNNCPENTFLADFNFPADCCSNRSNSTFEVLEGVIDSGFRVYIPNIINSESELICSTFFPEANEIVETVELFQLIDRDDNIIFENKDFLPNDETKGWTGTLNGEMVDGGFQYIVQVRLTNDALVEYQGIVCSVFCGSNFTDYSDAGLDLSRARWPGFLRFLSGLEPPLIGCNTECF
jgi:hypothetical protein